MSDHHKSDSNKPAHSEHEVVHFHDHSKLYLAVGAALLLMTGVTIAVSFVHFGSDEMNMVVGMIVAAIKATLVALIFMHLKEEKKTIYQFLAYTVIFVLALFLLTLLAYSDHIKM